MAVPITVGTNPVLISRTAAKPYLINNDGQTNAYLGQDTNVSSNNYAFILQPGQSLSWSEINREVWAKTLTGTTQVSIAYEAAAVASSSVNIASGSVTIGSGNVTITSGQVTAAVGNTPVLLATSTVTVSAGGTTTLPNITNIDISAYSSVIWRFVWGSSGGGATAQTLANGAYLQMTTFQDSNSLAPYAENYVNSQFTHPDGRSFAAVNQSLQLPVLSKYANANTIAIIQTAVGFRTGTLSLKLFGSYETVTAPRYNNILSATFSGGGGVDNPGAGVMVSDQLATLTGIDYEIGSKNGLATITLASGSTTLTRCAIEVFYYQNGTSQFLTNLALVAPGLTTLDYAEKANVLFPNLPIKLAFRQTGTTTSARLSVIQ